MNEKMDLLVAGGVPLATGQEERPFLTGQTGEPESEAV
jgi:hypothetical protein